MIIYTSVSNSAYGVPARITLEYVQGAFNCWYALRGRDKKIPEYLWQQVLKILPHYRKNKILGALRLTYPILNKHIQFTPRQQPLLKTVFPKSKPLQPPLSSKHLSPSSPTFIQVFLPVPMDNIDPIEPP